MSCAIATALKLIESGSRSSMGRHRLHGRNLNPVFDGSVDSRFFEKHAKLGRDAGVVP
jgi:hypothetical protein